MKKLITIVVLLIAIGAAGAFYYANRGEKEPTITTVKTSRGDIVDGVGATGTLQAVTTVTVGTQVSGIVQEMYADFNSIVKKGQVIARLDPSLLQTQVETAQANLTNANANLERQKVVVADAQSKLTRAKELADRQLINKVDLENAEVTAKQADAQLKSTQSQIVQAEAAVNKAKVDLDHTVITAPIDGIVIKRSVDKGQTVAASMSAPELFIIAADLTQMQVNANIDESDVGRIRPHEAVTFRVDAYPTETFHGEVRQVRLNPTTVQNVVTYSTVIDVPNPDYRLTPGMTANVIIEIARRTNVLRIPNAALRFRPTKEIFEALHQPMPPELERGFGRGPNGQRNAGGQGPGGGTPGAPAANAPASAPSGTAQSAAPQGSQPRPSGTATAGQTQAPRQGSGQAPRQGSGQAPANAQNGQPRENRGQGDQQARDGQPNQGGRGGFANMTPEERQKRMQERMAAMTPEERAQFEERMKQRQANGGGGGRGNFGGGQGQGNFQRNGNNPGGGSFNGGGQGRNSASGGNRNNSDQPARTADTKSAAATPTTIDAMFAPIQFQETRGRAWLLVNKELKLVSLRLGISDGTYTEVLNDDALQADQDVVTSVITPDMANRPAGQQNNQNNNNPLLPQRGGRGPGGPGGGGGGGRGR
jgi:HlyD family secretion protein